MISGKEMRKRLQAAQILLLEPSTTREKFSAMCRMMSGIDSRIDAHLFALERHLSMWDKVSSGDVIGLSAEHLPENTEEEKKRKKWLLLFINGWRQLQSEVTRVQAELSSAHSSPTGDKASHFGKILHFAKGPFGIITFLAFSAVVAAQATAVTITIQNKGCGTMRPSSSFPISLPGLKLPAEPIAPGGSADVVIPGFTVNVDGSQKEAVVLSILNYTLSFQLPNNVKDVTLNGASLLGKKTTVKLSEKNQHILSLICL